MLISILFRIVLVTTVNKRRVNSEKIFIMYIFLKKISSVNIKIKNLLPLYLFKLKVAKRINRIYIQRLASNNENNFIQGFHK